MTICLGCGIIYKALPSSLGMYCSNKCQMIKAFTDKYIKFLSGENNIFKFHSTQRRALIERDGNKCSYCGITDWQNKRITFEVEHKDGDSTNNTSINLCLLCPNCHTQTSTYKALNKGNGRHLRMIRYKEGKSF